MNIKKPIFLVGFPRSGTTFLQSLIATQPGIVSFPETHFYSILTQYVSDPKSMSESELSELIEEAKRMLLLEILPEELLRLRNMVKAGSCDRKSMFSFVLKKLCKRSGHSDLTENQRLLEKTPSHAFHWKSILHDYPDARFIWIKRHPVDSIASYKKNLSHGGKELSHMIAEWKRSHQAMSACLEHEVDKVFEIKYEDLKEDQLTQMSEVMRFIGQELDGQALSLHHEKAKEFIMPFETWKDSNKSAAVPKGVQQELKWKEKATIQFLLGETMKEQGYDDYNSVVQWLYNLKNAKA